MKNARCILLFLTISLVMASVAYGQRERRRQFVENLLEGLIESQLENLTDDREAGRNPVSPGQPVRVPVVVQAARVELEHLATSVRNLVSVLQHESYASPGYRQPLSEAMHIKAMCDGLYRNSSQATSLQPVITGYSQVDQAWRSLAHRLRQARGVNQVVLSMVDEVDEHAGEMVRLLEINPQLDRDELIRLSSSLTTEFRHLLDDVAYELNGHPQQVRILDSGRDLITRVSHSTALIDRGDYNSIVTAWQQGQAGWRAYAAELRRIGNDRIRRDVMRIEQTGRQINAALWLEVPIDRDYIGSLAGSLANDIDHILESITLNDLLASPDAPRLLKTAGELKQYSRSFGQSVGNASSIDDLVWDYRVFRVSWSDLVSRSQPVDNPEIRRHLASGNESMALLEQSLGGGLQLGRDEVLQMVARLGDLCNRTARFVDSQITPATHYDVGLRNDIRQQANGLQNSVRRLYTNMVGQQSNQIIRQDLDSAINYWNQLKPLMENCRESDRQVFHRFRSQMEPLFVKMQIVYLR